MARHRRVLRGNRQRSDTFELVPARRTIRLVDAGNGIEHRLTEDNLDVGHSGAAPYVALCGAYVLPAALATPERRVCPECVTRTIPAQH